MRKKHFLIQTVNGRLEYDFQQTLLNHFQWNKDLNRDFVYSLFEWDGDVHNIPTHKDTVPVGTVEFVTAYLQIAYAIHYRPINIPYTLRSFAGREFSVISLEDEIAHGWENGFIIVDHGKTHNKFFWKSADKMKAGYGIANSLDEIPKNIKNVFVSELIDIESEWRVFVHRDKIVDVKNYSGVPFRMINEDIVTMAINSYKYDSTWSPSYTLDFAVTKEGRMLLIEVHNFFSCGLYGFDDVKFPYMLSQTFFHLVKSLK